MGKATKITAGILGGVLLAGYSGLWFYTNQEHKREVENALLSLQNSSLIKSFTYEKVSVSGYPFKNNVVVHKPKIVFDMSQLMAYKANAPAIFKDNAKLAFYTDDALCFSTTAIFSDYQVLPKGDIHSVFIADSQEQDFVVEHGNSIKLNFHKSLKNSLFRTYSKIYAKEVIKNPALYSSSLLESFLVRMGDLDYTSGKVVIKDSHNNILSSSDSNHIKYKMDVDTANDLVAMHFDMDGRGLYMTENYAKTVNTLYEELNVATRLYPQQEAYGKHNVKMHLDVTMGNSRRG